jgi:hypothetical protein
MNFNEWFKEWTSKRMEKLQTTHPIISTLRRRAEDHLIRTNKTLDISSVFDPEKRQPSALHKVLYSFSDTYKYYQTAVALLKRGWSNIRTGYNYIGSLYRGILFKIDKKYKNLIDTKVVKIVQQTFDDSIEKRMRFNRRIYRLLKIRRFGNFWRRSAGIRTYHVIDGLEEVIVDRTSTLYKLFQVYRPKKMSATLALFIIFACFNYKLLTDLQIHQQINNLDNIEKKKKYLIFNKEKDERFLIVYNFINDIFEGKINERVDRYPQYEKYIPEINDFIEKNNQYKSLLILPIMTGFFLIFLYQSYLRKKQIKGFLKSARAITFQFLKYMMTSNLIISVMSLNSDNYMRFEIAKLLLDKEGYYPNILEEYHFFIENLKYSINYL